MGSEVRRIIGEWINSHPNIFAISNVDETQFIVTISLCTVEKLVFKVICDDGWNPMFVSSDESAGPDLLADGLAMINMDIQVNPSQSVYQVLTRALDAFASLIKSQPSVPETTQPPTQPAVLPLPIPPFTQLPIETPAAPTSTTLTTHPIPTNIPSHPTPTPTTTLSELTGNLLSDPGLRIRAEVEQWKRENGYSGLIVNTVVTEQFKADLSLTVHGIPCSFQILFDESWFPMIVVSNDIQLEDIVTHTNVLLEEQQAAANRSEQEGSPPRYTLVELLNVFGAAFNDDLRQKNLTDDIEEKVTPTAEDWENIIIPSCITYMNGSGVAGFEREEWARRVRTALRQQNVSKALTIVTQEIFGGAPLPSSISRFVPRRLVRPIRQSSGGVDYNTSGGSPEAVERLNNELLMLRASSSANARQFLVTPINNDLFLWAVRLIYSPTSDFGKDLVAFYKKANGGTFSKMIRIGNHSNAPEVHIEMRFPPTYPYDPPLLRIIRPRFLFTTSIETFFTQKTATVTEGNDTNNTTSTTTTASSDIETKADEPRRGLSVSNNFENALTNWDASFSIVDMLKQLHQTIQRQTVDVEHADDEFAIPTVGTFWRLYTCEEAGERLDIEHGGKIVLPPSAIEDLASQEFGDVNNFDRAEDTAASPMIFELSPAHPVDDHGNSVGRTFCGVAEFTAMEGTLIMPRWMMTNLGVQNGNLVQVRRVSLPRGSFLRLLPHNASFLHHANPKALLEWVLPHYVALTSGDIIKISFDDTDHILQVLEVSPGRAVCLTDSDISVDFAPPLNPSPSLPRATATTTTTTTTTATNPPASGGSTLGTLAQGNGVEGVDYQTCTNCFAPVPKDRYTMHSLSCPRINWFCDKCKKVVQRSQKDDHLAAVHAPASCPLGCDAVLERSQLDEHVAKDCPKRNRECEYCGLSITAANWHSHETVCGDRTEICEACGMRVQKREQYRHLSVCGTKQNTPSKPSYFPPSPPKRQDEDIFQCDKCMMPCSGFDELQVHMLTQHHDVGQEQSPTL